MHLKTTKEGKAVMPPSPQITSASITDTSEGALQGDKNGNAPLASRHAGIKAAAGVWGRGERGGEKRRGGGDGEMSQLCLTEEVTAPIGHSSLCKDGADLQAKVSCH
ncbi:hypothetical protein NQZ68_040895 [Dissostichus eleginoides]|nr:hypothetical protein NQZ68_040895 [Dissostichus eleginoides]